MPLTELLAAHEAALLIVTNREASRVIQALADSEAALVLALSEAPTDLERARLGALASRLATWQQALERRVRAVMDDADARATALAQAHAEAVVRQAGTVALTDATRLAAASALRNQNGLMLHQYSAASWSTRSANRIQAALVAGVLQGVPHSRLVGLVRSAAGPHRTNAREAELMVRMELSRAYSQAGGELAAVFYEQDNGWRKRIVEIIDQRNHPFSRVANGVTARPGETFRVPVADVEAVARAMKRKAQVLWPTRAGYYRGMGLPAHFGERGRVVPWHTSWGAGPLA